MTTTRRPMWQDSLHQEIADAISPLVTEMKEMREQIRNLQLSSVNRQDVYDKEVMDEKLAALKSEIAAANIAITASKEFVWKAIGVAGTVGVILATIIPNLHFGH